MLVPLKKDLTPLLLRSIVGIGRGSGIRGHVDKRGSTVEPPPHNRF